MGDLNSVASASGKSKKVILTQTGWPSNDAVWSANAKSAVASTSSEKQYFDLLDDLCPQFKKLPKGGAGWFAHSEWSSRSGAMRWALSGLFSLGGQRSHRVGHRQERQGQVRLQRAHEVLDRFASLHMTFTRTTIP